MVHVVNNQANHGVWWEFLSISNTNEWEVYVNRALEPFAMLVRCHNKAQPLRKLRKRKRKSKWKEKLKVGQMRERKFQRSLNRWRGRMRKRFWWTMTQMILIKKGIQYQQIGFSKYSVSNEQKREWEYKKNEVVQGSKCPNLEAIKVVVKL
jgi:hypothetical protein